MERKQLFRLCHVCDRLNESDAEILRCENCGKGFLPINYFEKIRARVQQAARESDGQNMPNITMSPIYGLIVFW